MHRLRDALTTAGYTYDGVAALLGPTAHAALSRNETTPGLRATGDGSPLATLTRLWLLQAPVEEEAAASEAEDAQNELAIAALSLQRAPERGRRAVQPIHGATHLQKRLFQIFREAFVGGGL